MNLEVIRPQRARADTHKGCLGDSYFFAADFFVINAPASIYIEQAHDIGFDVGDEQPNKAPEPTGVAAAFYPRSRGWFHIVVRPWLSFFR